MSPIVGEHVAERPLGWTPNWYVAWRVLFGTYLCVHFLQLLPWAMELWSSLGVVSDGSDSPLQLPVHLFALSDRPVFVTIMAGVAAMLSTLIAFGRGDRIAAVLLWYVWASLLARNPLIANPGLPFVGWLLLAHAVMPPVRSGPNRTRPLNWTMPRRLWIAAWIVMALSYTYSGVYKLQCLSWLDGSAIQRVLENPLARDTFLRTAVLALPSWLLAAMTYGALLLELLFAPLSLSKLLRPWIWLAMVMMHLGLMVLVDFVDLSVGMLMMHLFTLNPSWLHSDLRRFVRRELRGVQRRWVARHATA